MSAVINYDNERLHYSCEYCTCVKLDESSWDRWYVSYEVFWYPIHHIVNHHQLLQRILKLRTSYRGIWVAHSAAQKHATRACKQRILSVGLEDGKVKDCLELEYFLGIQVGRPNGRPCATSLIYKMIFRLVVINFHSRVWHVVDKKDKRVLFTYLR